MAILDDESLLATCAYIDLNPVAAGIAVVPEASPHTSIKQRVEHVQEQGRADDLKAAEAGSVAGSTASAGLEEALWLCPVEDRRRLDSSREGMIEGFSLGNYLLLVDYTGRLFRDGKAVISAELAGIFERLGSNAENWQARLQKLAAGRLLGRFFAASRARLREVAGQLGVHHLANLGGCGAMTLCPGFLRELRGVKGGFAGSGPVNVFERTAFLVGRWKRLLSVRKFRGHHRSSEVPGHHTELPPSPVTRMLLLETRRIRVDHRRPMGITPRGDTRFMRLKPRIAPMS